MAASYRTEDLSLQVLLRHAALRLRNQVQDTGTVVLDSGLAEFFDELAASADPPVSRDEMVMSALVDWAIEKGYLEIDELDELDELDEDTETEGNA